MSGREVRDEREGDKRGRGEIELIVDCSFK